MTTIGSLRAKMRRAQAVKDPVKRAVALEVTAAESYAFHKALSTEEGLPAATAAFHQWREAVAAATAAWEELPEPQYQTPAPERIPERIAAVKSELITIGKARNPLAAALIIHRGWPDSSIARLAGLSEIFSRGSQHKHRPAPDSPDLVPKFLTLAGQSRLLIGERNHLEELPATAGERPDGPEAMIAHLRRRLADAEATNVVTDRKSAATRIAKEAADLRKALLKDRDWAAKVLYDTGQVSLREIGRMMRLPDDSGRDPREIPINTKSVAKQIAAATPGRISNPDSARRVLGHTKELLAELQPVARQARTINGLYPPPPPPPAAGDTDED